MNAGLTQRSRYGVDQAQMPPPLRALILDDSTFDRRRILRLSANSGIAIQMDEVASLATLEIALEKSDFDIILVDYNLPEGNGIDAIKMVNNNTRNADCPTVMVAGDSKASIAVQAMRLGCADYISKDGLTAEKLRAAISTAIECASPKPAAVSDTTDRTQVVLDAVTREYSKLLQPELARLLRQMRALKSGLKDPRTNVPNDLELIEKRCIAFWELLRASELPEGRKAHLLEVVRSDVANQIDEGADFGMAEGSVIWLH